MDRACCDKHNLFTSPIVQLKILGLQILHHVTEGRLVSMSSIKTDLGPLYPKKIGTPYFGNAKPCDVFVIDGTKISLERTKSYHGNMHIYIYERCYFNCLRIFPFVKHLNFLYHKLTQMFSVFTRNQAITSKPIIKFLYFFLMNCTTCVCTWYMVHGWLIFIHFNRVKWIFKMQLILCFLYILLLF